MKKYIVKTTEAVHETEKVFDIYVKDGFVFMKDDRGDVMIALQASTVLSLEVMKDDANC